MKKFLLAICLFVVSTSVFAQSARTFVSIHGADSGLCPATTPCRSLSYAYTQTNSGGDIVMVDSGGFGFPFTISKAINIMAPAGVFGVIQINTNTTTGIDINAGVSDIVRIDGITFVGTGQGLGDIGIKVGQCKRAELSNITARHVQVGIKIVADTRVLIDGATIKDFNTGIWCQGVNADPASSLLKVTIMNTLIAGGDIGIKVDNGSTSFLGQNQSVEGNRVMYCHVKAWEVASTVSNCGQIYPAWYYSTAGTDSRNGNANVYGPCQVD